MYVILQPEVLQGQSPRDWEISAFTVTLSVYVNDQVVNYQMNTCHQVTLIFSFYTSLFNEPVPFAPKLENYRWKFYGRKL